MNGIVAYAKFGNVVLEIPSDTLKNLVYVCSIEEVDHLQEDLDAAREVARAQQDVISSRSVP